MMDEYVILVEGEKVTDSYFEALQNTDCKRYCYCPDCRCQQTTPHDTLSQEMIIERIMI